MGGEFSVDDAGLAPLADIHAQVADGLSQLAGAGGPQAADVARSFGNIAFAVNTALDGTSQSRTSAFQTTRAASETINELLTTADRMYAEGDDEGAAKLRAAAEAMEGSGIAGAGSTGSAGGGGTGAAAGGGGAETAGQMAGQVGQQVGQIAQGLAQSAQGLAQGLTQLPQQIMQGVQGIVESATKGTGSDAAEANEAKAAEDKAADSEDRKKAEAEEAAKREEQQRGQQHAAPTETDGAQPGHGDDGGRAPVPRPAPEPPQPAQTRPQQHI
ncbi:MAG: hypothetical protein JWR78_4785 [Mycobacterium sp.]|nr:hypothetical protein [Mycobacterium sp.]